jgi:hypothetical protein
MAVGALFGLKGSAGSAANGSRFFPVTPSESASVRVNSTSSSSSGS